LQEIQNKMRNGKEYKLEEICVSIFIEVRLTALFTLMILIPPLNRRQTANKVPDTIGEMPDYANKVPDTTDKVPDSSNGEMPDNVQEQQIYRIEYY